MSAVGQSYLSEATYLAATEKQRGCVGARTVWRCHAHGLNVLSVLRAYVAPMGQHQHLAEAVAAAIDTFEKLLPEVLPPGFEALARARVALVQAVNAYIAHFGKRVAALEVGHARQVWQEAYDEVIDLRHVYSRHIADFDAAAIRKDWGRYREGSRLLMAEMRGHLRSVIARRGIDA